jgi:hypothetical protein
MWQHLPDSPDPRDCKVTPRFMTKRHKFVLTSKTRLPDIFGRRHGEYHQAVLELAVRALVTHQARHAAERQRRGRSGTTSIWCSPTPSGGPSPRRTSCAGTSTRCWRLPGCHGSASTTCGIRWPRCARPRGAPKVVSEMLGHTDVGITLDLYSHVTATMQHDAARNLDALFGGRLWWSDRQRRRRSRRPALVAQGIEQRFPNSGRRSPSYPQLSIRAAQRRPPCPWPSLGSGGGRRGWRSTWRSGAASVDERIRNASRAC